ncbi:adenylate kinase family protein [Halobellus clavatus]|uniref:Putative adenylate kinase n=1 Tax=Halobellus clavatus TaxID=660517 RepID=A0A1H3I0V9_9EURY|nr:adenylate kinase family protein [Halobellus clavatus]SDY21331.1 adenylate kinase [Halobellus clavatus]
MTQIALTGTPGTGKTTVADLVEAQLDVEVLHLNDAIREADLFAERDVERDSLVADLDAVESWVQAETADDGKTLVESHLSHLLAVDRVIVLRCHPEELKPRLRERGESEASVAENAESEALDVILAEAVERHGEDDVWEIDTTDRSPEAVADDVKAAVESEIPPRVGVVDFIEYL